MRYNVLFDGAIVPANVIAALAPYNYVLHVHSMGQWLVLKGNALQCVLNALQNTHNVIVTSSTVKRVYLQAINKSHF
jgi:hypothetical protein